MTDDQRRTVLMAVATLLDYPGDDAETRWDAVADALPSLPLAAADPLAAFLAHARTVGKRALEEHYVDTFDQKRRCNLYLSYYATGDTRQRGVALLSFREMLAAVGLEQDRDELPDHLCVVCEAAALEPGSPENGDTIAADVLATHRDGIEVLRHALAGRGSAYAGLLDALVTALPPLDEDTRERYLRLVTAGPPAELVGTLELPFPVSNQETRS
ncbi:nitrate reductase molybdenum cofactor assembly chaperone [Corynebacterium xerosis]|uniref:Nitrate reductase molybdenum cofactor assembly chaperone n=2 Tax=Corynebacterium xerosis TaxID=1725 RepID=A0A7X9SV78_9CORY|nr:nitrate reductase molybdenum cofactor assembly chaperone [Corynebacterium xerosis]NMF08715.1 nitrate reductase molybdenum cofactor assembly chaperone [Corynebacterium xerosis]